MARLMTHSVAIGTCQPQTLCTRVGAGLAGKERE
jgi:hypothetical protein